MRRFIDSFSRFLLQCVDGSPNEKGLYYRDSEFKRLLGAGRHWFWNVPGRRGRVDLVSLRVPFLTGPNLDLIVKSGALEGHGETLDLKDYQRALVWIDGRFATAFGPGLHAYLKGFRDVRVEIVDATQVRFEHKDLHLILKTPGIDLQLHSYKIDTGHVAVVILNGQHLETLGPGLYAFWRRVANVKLRVVDMREAMLDIAGQDIMTADKVTLRLNAVVSYRVADAYQTIVSTENAPQALYREAQLVLREAVGGRDLDTLLADKETLAREIEESLGRRVGEFGLRVTGAGVRDIILPGEMKDLLNKVTEAKKVAEANLITRREETAAMRGQANTARILDGNPTLMRLRELEVLEKIAASTKMHVVLGEKGLADRVMNLL